MVLRLLLAQGVLSVVVAALFWGLSGQVAGYSALTGGLTCVIPNAFLALRLMLPRREAGARALLRAAYIGEIGKLALTVVMLTMAFLLIRPLAAGALITGFVAAQLMTLSVLLMRDKEVVENNNGD